MKDAQRDVKAFHEAMNCGIGDQAAPGFSNVELRLRLIREEVKELHEACGYDLNGKQVDGAVPDFPAAVDALADIQYVTVGSDVEWGVDAVAVWDAVQAANMAKVGGVRRADGKIGKPEGWQPPDIAKVLRAQVRRAEGWVPRPDGCECHEEMGDSPCRVHPSVDDLGETVRGAKGFGSTGTR